MCGCQEPVQTGLGYAGADERERNRHRARRQQQLKTQERTRERRRIEQRALLNEHGMNDLTLTGLIEAAETQLALAQALAAEAVGRAARCDEASVLARITDATQQAVARLTTVELANERLRSDLSAAEARLAGAEARAVTADRDAAAVQQRMDRGVKRSSGATSRVQR